MTLADRIEQADGPSRELDASERNAISSLRRLAKCWLNSLWLFSASGTLCVMKRDKNGDRFVLSSGGVDPSAVIETINIPNDGGDW